LPNRRTGLLIKSRFAGLSSFLLALTPQNHWKKTKNELRIFLAYLVLFGAIIVAYFNRYLEREAWWLPLKPTLFKILHDRVDQGINRAYGKHVEH
jgi:hypothetical protein